MSETPDKYNINVFDYYTNINESSPLTKFFWNPNPIINSKLIKYVDNLSPKHVIDVGCGIGTNIFPKATHILGLSTKVKPDNITQINFDLDFDKFELPDKYFEFAYCRHTLEDIQNPQNAFQEITRVASAGYIETPSPIVEITKGVNKNNMRGYIHHRYIVWSDLDNNTLYFLPKYPLIEDIVISKMLTDLHHHMLNNYPIYWNNYYMFDAKHPPNIVVYRNEVNFNITTDYAKLINTAIRASIKYTDHFIQLISSF